jgi:hypothetical protein
MGVVLCDTSVDFTHTQYLILVRRPEGPSRHDVSLLGVVFNSGVDIGHDLFEGLAGLGVDGLDGVG